MSELFFIFCFVWPKDLNLTKIYMSAIFAESKKGKPHMISNVKTVWQTITKSFQLQPINRSLFTFQWVGFPSSFKPKCHEQISIN